MWAAIKLAPLGAKIGLAVGMLLALAALFFSYGHIQYEKGLNVSKVAISQYQTKVAQLNTKLVTAQGKVTTDVITKYQDRVKTVTVTQVKNHDVIVSNVPSTFNLTNGWVYSYNRSVLGLAIDPTQASVSTLSGITDKAALDTLDHNNDVAIHNADQLAALQDWIRKQEEVNEKVGHDGTPTDNSVQPTTSK